MIRGPILNAKSRFAVLLALLFMVAAFMIPVSVSADVLLSPTEAAASRTVDSAEPDDAASSSNTSRDSSADVVTSMDDVIYWLELLATMMLPPLLLTVVIETPIVAMAGRGRKASWQVGLLVNTLTNPIAVLLALGLWPLIFWSFEWLGWLVVGTIEVGVLIVEAIIFMRLLDWSRQKSFGVALIANLASFGLGLGAFLVGF